jgi:hypothetical protein
MSVFSEGCKVATVPAYRHWTVPANQSDTASSIRHSPTLAAGNNNLLHWLHAITLTLTLSNPIFLPPAYSPALIYFGRERGWWVTCNYPTVLKEKNTNGKSTTCAICWLKSALREQKSREQENHNVGLHPTLWFSCSRRLSSCSTDFSQQIAQVVLFLFMFFSFKTVG